MTSPRFALEASNLNPDQSDRAVASLKGRSLLTTLRVIAFISVNIVAIHLAVSARGYVFADRPEVRHGVDPEFVSLAVQSAIAISEIGIVICYLLARSVEGLVLQLLKGLGRSAGGAWSVDLTTFFLFAWAAVLAPEIPLLASAPPGIIFLAIPPIACVAAMRSGSGRSTMVRVGVVSCLFVAVTLLAFGRWS